MSKKQPNPHEAFLTERKKWIGQIKRNRSLQKATKEFMKEIAKTNYTYNFSWLGRPVIQFPQDLFQMQEIIWKIKPDFIIETGIAHGGSLIFFASMVELIGKGKIIGIDIDIRKHNRAEIEKHSLSHRIIMFEGSSTSSDIIDKVLAQIKGAKSVLVSLDSNHTHEHVLKELKLYSPFVSVGSYCIVCDTGIEDYAQEISSIKRPWGKGNNPKTAVREFLKNNKNFIIDGEIENKLLITVAPGGYLKRIK